MVSVQSLLSPLQVTAAALLAASATLLALRAGKKRRRVTKGGPLYSKAIAFDSIVYVSGQVAVIPGTTKLVHGGIESQTRQAILNLKQALEESGSSLDRVLKTTCFLNDIADYAAFNKIYLEFFNDEGIRPARVCFGPGGLPLGALVEIDATAMC